MLTSSRYVDATAAPVLVYDVTLAETQKVAAFAWLLLPSASSRSLGGATLELTTVDAGTVGATVTIDGQSVDISVPFETSK